MAFENNNELNNGYNIDLSSVEEVFLNNEKKNNERYIKYYDEKNKMPVMLKTDKPVKEVIEKLQDKSINFKSNDANHNTMGLLNLEEKYTKHKLEIIPIDELNEYSFNDLSSDQVNIINLFVKNKDRFNPKLKYINLEKQIALDEKNNVITCIVDKEKNRIDFRQANKVVHKHEEFSNNQMNNSQVNNNPMSNSQNMFNNLNESKNEFSFNNIDNANNNFESSNDSINVDIDSLIDNVVYKNIPVEVDGEMIDKSILDKYYNYQELLATMSPNKRDVWKKIIAKYEKKIEEQNKQDRLNNPPKVLVKTENKNIKNNNGNNAGFATDVLTTFVSGFAVGLIISLLLFVLIRVFFS